MTTIKVHLFFLFGTRSELKILHVNSNKKKTKNQFKYIIQIDYDCNDILECDDDPCDCSEVLNCRQSTCHSNGCDQCNVNYWKKDYNYHCVSCDIFGDDCMHCTDFLRCQQCRDGTRTYDESCGVWYCDSGSNLTGCASTKPTITSTPDPTNYPTPNPTGDTL